MAGICPHCSKSPDVIKQYDVAWNTAHTAHLLGLAKQEDLYRSGTCPPPPQSDDGKGFGPPAKNWDLSACVQVSHRTKDTAAIVPDTDRSPSASPTTHFAAPPVALEAVPQDPTKTQRMRLHSDCPHCYYPHTVSPVAFVVSDALELQGHQIVKEFTLHGKVLREQQEELLSARQAYATSQEDRVQCRDLLQEVEKCYTKHGLSAAAVLQCKTAVERLLSCSNKSLRVMLEA
eukprot:gene706-2505_t